MDLGDFGRDRRTELFACLMSLRKEKGRGAPSVLMSSLLWLGERSTVGVQGRRDVLEFRKTRHPRNVEFNGILEVCFFRSREFANLGSLGPAKSRIRECAEFGNLDSVKRRSHEHAEARNLNC
jgi:hypothetical protein